MAEYIPRTAALEICEMEYQGRLRMAFALIAKCRRASTAHTEKGGRKRNRRRREKYD